MPSWPSSWRFVGVELEDLVEAAPDDLEVLPHDLLTEVAELLVDLRADAVEETLFVQPVVLHQRRRVEEGAHERGALHTEAQVLVGRDLHRDLEGVDVVDLVALLADLALGRLGQRVPEGLRRQAALDDEDAAFLQPREGVRVAEDVRVGREDHADLLELTVEPDRLLGQRGVERRRLALLLGTVLRVGLDEETEQIGRRLGQVLAHRDGAPPTHGVDADRRRTLGEEVHLRARIEREIRQMGVAVQQFLLPDLELRQARALPDEIDPQVVLPELLAALEHVVERGDDVVGLEVAAAEPEAPRVELGDVVDLARGDARMHGLPGTATVFDRLPHRGAGLAQQRCVDGQRLIGPLQEGHGLLALEHVRQLIGRERAEHRHLHDADLEPPRLAEVVGHGLGVRNDRALTGDHVLRVVHPVAHDALVLAPREGGVLVERPIRDGLDVVEVERALRGHALRVAVLVLHRTEHGGEVEIVEFGHAPALLTEHETLRGRRRVDDVGRVAEVLVDERRLRHVHRLDRVAGQEAVLRANARVQRQLGDPSRDQVEVRRLLHVLREELEEARVVDAVVVVVPGVDVQGVLRHGAARHVEHVGETLADRGIERLVHVRDALAAGEVGRAQPREAHARGDGRRRVLALGFEEQQLPAAHVGLAGGERHGEPLAHLGGRGDRVRARGIAAGRLHGDDRAAAVGSSALARVAGLGGGITGGGRHEEALPASSRASANCAYSTQRMAPVGQRWVASLPARSFFA